MTGNSTAKIRGVLLAALLVLSVVSVGAAPAAAQTQDATLSLGDAEASPGDTVEVTLALSNATNVASYAANISFDPAVVEVQSVSGVDFPDPITNINNESGWVSMTASVSPTSPVDNPTFATITFHVEQGTAGQSTTLGFNSASVSNAEGNTIPISLDSGSITVPESATVTFNDQIAVGGEQVSVNSAYLPNGGYVAVKDADGNILGWSSELPAGTHNDITVALSPDISSDSTLTAVAYRTDQETPYQTPDGQPVQDSASVSYVDADAQLQSGQTYWSGQTLYYSGQPNEAYQIRTVTDNGDIGGLVTEVSADENGAVVINTGGFDGNYVLTTDSNSVVDLDDDGTATVADDQWEVATQTLQASIAADTVTNGGGDALTDLTLDSNRGGYAVYVTWSTDADVTVSDMVNVFDDNFDAMAVDISDAVGDDAVKLSGLPADTTKTINFTNVPAGNYDLTFEVTDTGVTSSDSVNVTSLGAAEASFAQGTAEEQIGDIASFTINLQNTNSAYLVIGDEADEDVNYQLNAEVTDGDDNGKVTVQFNSYTAGNDGQIVSVADSDDSITVAYETNLSEVLAPGTYPLAVSAQANNYEEALNSPQAVGTIFLTQRSTDSISSYRMPASQSVDEVSDIYEGMKAGTVTQGTTLAVREGTNGMTKGLAKIKATGLFGAYEAADGDSGLEKLLYLEQEGVIDLTVKQTDASTGANLDPKVLNLANSQSAVTVLEDPANNSLYVAVDFDAAAFQRGGNGDTVSAAAGDEFHVEFTVPADSPLSTDSANAQSITTPEPFALEEAQVTLNYQGDKLQVPQGNATINGSTNLAPGTEMTVRVQSTTEQEPFLVAPTVTVQPDGTFSTTIDVSQHPINTTFTVNVKVGGQSYTTIDGVIVESMQQTTTTTQQTTTTTQQTTTTTQQTTTTTQQPTTTTTQQPTTKTTQQQTPGFGVAVSLLALIGAALVALRRRN